MNLKFHLFPNFHLQNDIVHIRIQRQLKKLYWYRPIHMYSKAVKPNLNEEKHKFTHLGCLLPDH